MGIFFGTDGLRGVVNEELTFEVAYKCGNALPALIDSPFVLIGRDTRVSGEYLTVAVAGGVMSGGGRVIDLGIVPTSAVAYLTRALGADFGVVISASHNPKEYNGIKVFDRNGYKLSDDEEERIERTFITSRVRSYDKIGSFKSDHKLVKKYEDFLTGASERTLSGLTVVLDGANGAACRVAPAVFRSLGANVIATNCFDDGMRINERCGALYPETLVKRMKRYKADVGFAFDGDADRLIAVSADGRIIDGDMIIYMLAKHMKARGVLNENTVVGTSHTNMGIEAALSDAGIKLIRTDIGDKYVLARLVQDGLSLGGEQSGHIILKDIHSTGDGILCAIAVANMMAESGKGLDELFDAHLYPQTNINITVKDKLKIMNSEHLMSECARVQNALSGIGRVMVRASGTEPKIRVMVESADRELNTKFADEVAALVRKIDGDI
ncbi:MAG: phosphoglucosamine mutase [Clostridia bacterium]|nr:phosphoglucosamine mutase [Clostridia bacterium]